MAYEKIEVKEVPKTWGKEVWMANTESYCGKELHVRKGRRCSLHFHKVKDEVFYVRDGRILLELKKGEFVEESVIEKGNSVRIRPHTPHRFGGLKDSVIIEISTHHEDSDSYRIEVKNDIPPEVMKKYNG